MNPRFIRPQVLSNMPCTQKAYGDASKVGPLPAAKRLKPLKPLALLRPWVARPKRSRRKKRGLRWEEPGRNDLKRQLCQLWRLCQLCRLCRLCRLWWLWRGRQAGHKAKNAKGLIPPWEKRRWDPQLAEPPGGILNQIGQVNVSHMHLLD